MLSITTPSASSNTVNPDNLASSHIQASEGKKKKRKKHPHDDVSPDSAEPKEKRKKKRKQADLADNLNTAPAQEEAPPAKKKKGKGKAREKPLAAQTDAEIEANTQETAAALLSAIVAASVTTPNAQMQVQPTFGAAPAPHSQYLPFPPPLQFPYQLPPPASPPFDVNSAQHPSVFSHTPENPGGNAFSELAFGSNEDVLRALQDLDMTKIACVLKTLSEAAAAASANPNYAPQLSFLPSQLEPAIPVLKQTPAPSNTILGIPPRLSLFPEPQKRIASTSLAGSHDQPINSEHAHLLATKWLNASKLADLVRDEGLVYKKGKFSATEEAQLGAAMLKYQSDKGLTEDQLLETIFAKNDKNKDNAFWSDLTAAVPLRPIIAVYHHIRRTHHPMKQQGPWKEEEDLLLKQAVADIGQHWEKVSFRVRRMASDCRDRYRNHIVNREIRVTGHWSKDEEDKLTRIVTDMTVNQGKDIDNDVFWGKVSDLMGGKRGRQQCRIKWTDALSKTVKNAGQKPRWSQQDAFILVHKVDSLNVRDDTEIDWKTLPDSDWNLWSAHALQRRWLTMKKGVKGYEDMTHQEIMDILRIKKAHLPEPPTPSFRKRKERKVISAAAILENESRDATSNDHSPIAGPSTAPGALNHIAPGGSHAGGVSDSEGD